MIEVNRIPLELRQRSQWVVWKYTTKDNGQQTKTPMNPRTPARNASATNPGDWSTFSQAHTVLEEYGDEYDLAGIGFVFTANDPYIGVDLDDCYDAKTRLRNPEYAWVEDLASYTEVSPSGKGVKVIFKGKLPEDVDRRSFTGGNGIYESGRFFTITGNVYSTFDTIRAVPEETLRDLLNVWFPKQERGSAAWESTGEVLTDSEVIRIATQASNGHSFAALYRGDWEEYDSQSEADAALCTMLAFYCGPNHAQVDRLFRASGLYRDKWDDQRGNQTYGETTVENVIDNMDAYFTPKFGVMLDDDDDVAGTVKPVDAPPTRAEAKKAWQTLIEPYNALQRAEMPPYLRLLVEHLEPLGGCFVGDWLEMSALAFFSALWPGKKFENLPLNLWSIGISRQGTGKSVVGDELDTLTRLVHERLGYSPLGRYSSGSSAGLVRRLDGRNATVLAYFSEWSGFAKGMDNDHSSNMREVLMDLYDGRSIYHQLASETVQVINPFLCINALTTPASWANTADSSDLGSGFYSRFMFIAPDVNEGVGFKHREDHERVKVADVLVQHIEGLPGFFRASFVNGEEPHAYLAYATKLGLRGKAGVFDLDNSLLVADEDNIPSGRLAARVKKVAALMALLRERPNIKHDTLWVDNDDVKLAIRIVGRAAAYAVRAFALLARSKDDQDAMKVKRALERNESGLTELGLIKATGLSRAETQRAVELLADEGLVTHHIQSGRKLFYLKRRD